MTRSISSREWTSSVRRRVEIRVFPLDWIEAARMETLNADTVAQIETLKAEVADKDALIDTLNASIAEQAEALKTQIAEKEDLIKTLEADSG